MKRVYTPAKKKSVLIVDNDQIFVPIYEETFQLHGLEVEVANSPELVLEKLAQSKFDLVILDLCLPGTNGLEILTGIRRGGDATLPVIVFANPYLGKQGREALAAGANKCLSKGETTPATMLGIVRELLGDSQPPATDAVDEWSELQSQRKLGGSLLAAAPQTLAKLRAGYQVVTRTEDPELLKAALSDLQTQVHPLVSAVHLSGFRKIAQMAGAMEGLSLELHANPQKLTRSVARTLGQAIDTLAHLTVTVSSSNSDDLELPKVLVVDDEVISREAICSALRKAHLTPVSLDDSLAAETLLTQEHFDLIFLDVEMPGKSGLELCASIRAMPTNRTTPVVYVTSHSDFAMQAKSVLSGGNDFIAKPFLSVELALKALTWLFPVKARLAASATPPPEPNVTAKPKASALA